jgi:Zn-finger nucleic acid-binding protein
VTETYVCSNCRTSEQRSYRVQFFVQTCPECGEHGWFVHESLLDVLETVPTEDRPADWDEMSLEDRFRHVAKRGLIDWSDLRV